jgi:transcriptional antiterminator RfaH
MVWYAVRAKRGQEARVVAHLTPRGVGTLLPLLEVVRRYRTRRVTLLEPLFPGYLFVRTPPAAADPRTYDRVRWAPGVRYVLGTEEGPVTVPDEVIGAIQARVAELGFVRPRRGYDRGARVRFLRGPLEGLEAVFDRPMSRTGRVRVLLDLLGQPRGVEVDLADLESA